jgi:hypothetical protein
VGWLRSGSVEWYEFLAYSCRLILSERCQLELLRFSDEVSVFVWTGV